MKQYIPFANGRFTGEGAEGRTPSGLPPHRRPPPRRRRGNCERKNEYTVTAFDAVNDDFAYPPKCCVIKFLPLYGGIRRRTIKMFITELTYNDVMRSERTAAGTRNCRGGENGAGEAEEWRRSTGGSGEERWEGRSNFRPEIQSALTARGLYSAYRPHFARELAHGCLMKY
ncbi:hypothetical protein EVAR_103443_1 [Eumeta japonica]|uniref:Uncharacterized protein n=1 Tax=Eumeta variegata TaxID=151549 RepID=A0A4C1Z3T5_EUMVA|nr:hypothetical protein EVAR_103443_1 [Eumeta japonica]